MRNRFFGTLIFLVVLIFAVPSFSQGQDKVSIPANDKSVEWVDIRVPKFPPLARQARILERSLLKYASRVANSTQQAPTF